MFHESGICFVNADFLGMLAVRKNRYIILPKDFEKAYKNQIRQRTEDYAFYK